MINKIINYIQQNKMIEKNDAIVLGVSGGADSVCLLYALQQLRKKWDIKLFVVHVNHGIRGEEAYRDQKFVEGLCEKWKVWYRCVAYDVPKLAGESGMSEEEMGRKLRYETFLKILNEVSADKIAVAHNSNDSVETVIYNMCRGTGIKGMSGIIPVRGEIIRPLLCCTRSEIEEYLAENNVEYIVDSTNLKCDYTRNRIRLEVIPYLKENINERVEEHILGMAKQCADIWEYLQRQAKAAFDKCVKESDEGIFVDRDKLVVEPEVIQKEIIRECILRKAGKLKDITMNHVESVRNLMLNDTGKKLNLPYDIVCENVYNQCHIYIKEKQQKEEISPIDVRVPGIYDLPDGSRIIFNLENSMKFEEKLYTKWFDYDKINNAIQIRTRENGDYFEVVNGGRKKLKSYFIDEKVPREQRDRIPLLSDGNHIIWVIGHRISERYKITEETRCVLKVQYVERNGNDNGR